MGTTLHVSGDDAAIAIFDEGTNLNLLSDPMSYRANINFHTGLAYLHFQETITTTVNFTAVASDTVTWDDASGGCGCCWVMLEARYGNGVMDEVVRKFRDEYMTPRNKRGYYKLAEVLVPLMRRYKLFQKLIEWTFAYPAVKYGEWYYGRNKWGWVFTPFKYFWLGLFEILGQDTEFVRENGEVV